MVNKRELLMNVNLYYYNTTDNTLVPEKRSVDRTENHNEVVSRVEAAYREGPKATGLSVACKDGVDFEILNNDKSLGDTIEIDLSEAFDKLPESERLVCIGSLVYTFSDISFIDNVRLSVDGRSLADEYDMQSGDELVFNKENVVNNPIINPEKINKQRVVLYFKNQSGDKLVSEERSIEVKQSQTLEYQIVEQLTMGPTKDGLLPTIPEGTKIKDIKTEDGICYVNLSGEFVNKLSGNLSNEKLTIYSIVNSLTELNSVNKVQFLIDGEKINDLKGHYDFSKTFERDESMNEK
jgi:germination protein M